MKNKTVLVTGSGSIIGQGIIKSLKLANSTTNNPIKYKIVCGDMSHKNASIYRGDVGVILPSPNSENYVTSIIEICKKNSVDAVFVGSDEELIPLSENKNTIEEKTGSKVISNPLQTIKISLDKWNTFEFLKKNNLSCADSCLPEEKDEFIQKHGLPLVVKPRQGHGSLYFSIVHSIEELNYAVKTIEKVGWSAIIQEYLEESNEYTTGVTVAKNGKTVMSSIAMKKILKHGQTYKAFLDDFKAIREHAENIALKLGATGPINVQCCVDTEIPKTFEINPRFSATMPIRAVAGVNEVDIVFRNFVLGEEIKITDYKKLVCFRYWNEVYVPYSDYEKLLKEKKIDSSGSYVVDYF